MNEKNKIKIDKIVDNIISENIDSIIADRFSKYSKYIIQQRALPDVRDGLKPVQRRILYSMSELGLFANKPFKKSARVVGDVIGKYHPHGDSSIYEAMVRMAQDWKIGHTLIEMHGNVGSIDDDPAAAMRYTEVRLAKISEYILGDLKKNTVKYAPNFDDSEKEPIVFPSIIPNLLLNGAKGIASGYATDMPPHNLKEIIDAAIELIKNPTISIPELMQFIKGPDFPTGGVIYGTQGIKDAFNTGKGRIVLVSKYTIQENKNNKIIEINEIPYGVIKAKLVRDIDILISNGNVNGLIDVKDMSDRDGISIIINLEKDADIDTIINFLLQKTELQIYYNVNSVAIVNNSPTLCNLRQLLGEYICHVKDIKTKTLKFNLAKYKARLEIVEGFIKVSEISDEIIQVIKNSENGKQGVVENLIKHFNFTLNQATAIAELRLYRLSKTDKAAFIAEKNELEKLIKQCEMLLKHPSKFDLWIIELLKAIKQEFGIDRRTQINEEQIKIKYDELNLVTNEDVIILITKHGYIKRFNLKIGQNSDWTTFGIKEEDRIVFYNNVNTTHHLLVFSNLGNYALIPVYKTNESKWKEYGFHLSDFVELLPGEEVVSVIAVSNFEAKNYICLFSRQGQGKRVILKDFYVSRNNKTFIALQLKDDDQLVNAKLSDGNKQILIATKKGLASMYDEDELQIYGLKASGVKACFLSGKDEIADFALVQKNEIINIIANEKYIKRINQKDIAKVSKKHLGKPLFNQLKTKQLIIQQMLTQSQSDKIFVKNNNNETIIENISSYPISTTLENFNKIAVPNILNTSFYFGCIANETKSNNTIEMSKKNIKSNIETENELDNVLDMDVDAILKKYEIE
ncbi:DNA topoisomerase IV subunit A [Mycoplasmopsis phocirhinis]|uniref:DNA topoisomerase (ATP-hydrolyzing) n=1 Tax=Mycoplasmopsis phocirhinis TaxID=142650 RepID=A0A4P6MRF1_9BACT|nr:DNA topoisomerase IV subunit A [Mycoplasmopsis phocirhinis]QBF34401.1 DNA topoisomerase IV subunit A [Mycoplasmopsis phocirhinis]